MALNKVKKPVEIDPEPFGEVTPDTESIDIVKMVLYGASGAGKTTMAATFPGPLFLNIEGGLKSIRHMPGILRLPKEPNKKLSTFRAVKNAITIVEQEFTRKEPPRFKTVVVDSLNSLQVVIKRNILKEFPNDDRNFGTSLTQPDYLKLMDDMLETYQRLLDLPCNVVFTCVTASKEYESDKEEPKFIGKATGPEIIRLADMVGHVFTRKEGGQTRYLVNFKDSQEAAGKDRFNITPDNDLEATYQAIFSNLK